MKAKKKATKTAKTAKEEKTASYVKRVAKLASQKERVVAFKKQQLKDHPLASPGRKGNSGTLKLTKKNRNTFLAKLADTAMVIRACDAIGICRQTAYNWRADNAEFEKAWDIALAVGASRLEDEGMRRSVEGIQRGVYYQGEMVDVITEYSDGLLQFMLSAHNHKYGKQRQELSGPDGAPLPPSQLVIKLVPAKQE